MKGFSPTLHGEKRNPSQGSSRVFQKYDIINDANCPMKVLNVWPDMRKGTINNIFGGASTSVTVNILCNSEYVIMMTQWIALQYTVTDLYN